MATNCDDYAVAEDPHISATQSITSISDDIFSPVVPPWFNDLIQHGFDGLLSIVTKNFSSSEEITDSTNDNDNETIQPNLSLRSPQSSTNSLANDSVNLGQTDILLFRRDIGKLIVNTVHRR